MMWFNYWVGEIGLCCMIGGLVGLAWAIIQKDLTTVTFKGVKGRFKIVQEETSTCQNCAFKTSRTCWRKEGINCTPGAVLNGMVLETPVSFKKIGQGDD